MRKQPNIYAETKGGNESTLLDRQLTVVVTGVKRTGFRELREALADFIGVEQRVDLDYGLEHCEELMLQNSTVQADRASIAVLVESQPTAALTITRNIARELSHRVRSASALLSDENADTPAEWANRSLGTVSRF